MPYVGQTITDVFPTSINVDTATIATANISNQLTDANMSAGCIIQVLQATDEGQRTISSTSYATCSNTLSVDITPASASSKFLVSFDTESYFATDNVSHYLTIYRDSTDIGNSSGYGLARGFSSSSDISMGMDGTILDSPNTTSEITYQVYAKLASGSGPAYFNSQTIGTLTVLEIKS